MAILTLEPWLVISGARSDAQEALGDSLVPRRASVRIDTSSSGFSSSASLMVVMSSCSVFPMYRVDK